MATTQDLKNWLVETYHDYDLDPEPRRGTWGLIWFLKSKHANSYPDTIALKTLAPERLNSLKTQENITYLRKEFEMWLNLPVHMNVVQATRLDTAHLTSGDQKKGMISLPVMLMPKMEGSLQDWVDNPTAFSMEDRLIALAQSLNGLLHLYKHKFEGHGDLKPSNILYRNERTRLVLDDRKAWPSLEHPWIIKIADLGWANAWIHFGFTDKVEREYRAPERFKDKFIPYKSDMFSMGVIAAELLQGRHPAPNLKKVNSDGKWDRGIAKRDWKLDGIIGQRVQNLILKCLAYNHEDRPTPEEFLSEICAELRETHSQDIGPTLQNWNERKLPAISEYHRAAWVASQTSDLGNQEAKRSRENIEQRIKGINVLSFESYEGWLTLAKVLFDLLKSEGGLDSAAKIDQLRDSAKRYMQTVFGNIDRHSLESVAPRGDWSTTTNTSVQPFERFSYAIRDTAYLAGVTYESEAVGAGVLGPLALAVFAFSAASDAFFGNGKSNLEYFLAEAIRHAPEQAVPYFYRARWRWNRWMASSSTMNPNAEDLAPWVADLEIAIRLSPTWEAPRSLLQSLQSGHHTAQ